MLPQALVASSLGFATDRWLVTSAVNAEKQGPAVSQRLKGKARKDAKKRQTAVASVSSTETNKNPPQKRRRPSPTHLLNVRDFAPMAEWIASKATPVPTYFQVTLDRMIAVRLAFPDELTLHGKILDSRAIDTHAFFVNVLNQVRDILRPHMKTRSGSGAGQHGSGSSSAFANRFSNLKVSEPSQEFLDAPDFQQVPPTPTDGSPVFALRQEDTLEEAMFALVTIINDLIVLRSRVEWIWSNHRDGAFDLAAAAIATNTTIELAKDMSKDVMPLIEKNGGLRKMLQMFYSMQLVDKGYPIDELMRGGDLNLDTYDVAEQTFFAAFRLLDAFLRVMDPHHLPVYKDGMFGYYDPSTTRAAKIGQQKFADDRAITMPLFSDLLAIVRLVPGWPVHDGLVSGMSLMSTTGEIPLYAVFALQCHLDITYTMGESITTPLHTFVDHTTTIVNDLNSHLKFHENLKITNWPASNDKALQQITKSVEWIASDPVQKVQDKVKRELGFSAPNTGRATTQRFLASSPVMCGLLLFHYRAQYREVGLAVADAWGSISYAMHLLNAVQNEGFLRVGAENDKSRSLSWVDMDIARMVPGYESFYVGGQAPKTREDCFKLFCLQMGTTAAIFAQIRQGGKKSKQKSKLESKTGPKGLKPGATVQSMFMRRYVNDNQAAASAADMSVDLLEKVLELSLYEREDGNDAGKGGFRMGQIEDEEKVWAKKQKAAAASNTQIFTKPKSVAQGKKSKESRIAIDSLIESLTMALTAETLEFAFPFLHMHRWSWRVLEAVKDACHPLLTELYTRQYMERDNQLPWVVGWIFLSASGLQDSVVDLRLLEQAGYVISEFVSSGAGRLITDVHLKQQLGLIVEMEVEDDVDKPGDAKA